MHRLLMFLCLTACVRAAADEKTNALTAFSGALERLAATVAPAVVQVQVSSWCASASASSEECCDLYILPGGRLGRHRRSFGIHHHQ